uniref:Uncharacterized protein n=1 Tax=Anguilla anguilla TaxID=7936 RepID=A0A0E9XLZ6_ANGAN
MSVLILFLCVLISNSFAFKMFNLNFFYSSGTNINDHLFILGWWVGGVILQLPVRD